MRLSGVTKIVQGQGNNVCNITTMSKFLFESCFGFIIIMAYHFQIRSQKQSETEKECHSFSLIYANGDHSLDLVIFVIYI